MCRQASWSAGKDNAPEVRSVCRRSLTVVSGCVKTVSTASSERMPASCNSVTSCCAVSESMVFLLYFAPVAQRGGIGCTLEHREAPLGMHLLPRRHDTSCHYKAKRTRSHSKQRIDPLQCTAVHARQGGNVFQGAATTIVRRPQLLVL